MNYRRAQDVITLILTTVLQPRCALCDQNHRLPDRLCPACKISVSNALSLHFAPHSNIHSMSRSHSNVFPREILGRGIPAPNHLENIEGLNGRVSVFNYQGAIAELVTRWKYRGMIELTGYIADLIYADCPRLPEHDIVTVIPSHWQRRFIRGFDPVWLLANALTKKHLIRKPTSLLQAREHLPFQHLKRFDQRHIPSSHFRVMKDVYKKRVIVLDDVVTSGSTLNAAAIALKKASAESVYGFTLASADRRSTAHA